MKALLLYPSFPDTFWSFRHSLKFIHKKSAFPPLGLLTVGAMLPDEWEKKVVDLNVAILSDEDFRTSIRIGIFGKERVQYWNLLVWTLFRCPKLLPLAITLAIHGHHFRKICKL